MPCQIFVGVSADVQTGPTLRAIIVAQGFAMSNPVVDRPMCPTCKHRMALARISPGARGFEERTFECATCRRTQKASFPVDPIKTDAVGWLAGELRPRRQKPGFQSLQPNERQASADLDSAHGCQTPRNQDNDLDAQAQAALDEARAMPPGPKKTEALREARTLRNAADVRGFIFAKLGSPPKG